MCGGGGTRDSDPGEMHSSLDYWMYLYTVHTMYIRSRV